MALDKISEEQHDLRRVSGSQLWIDKYKLLEKRNKELNEELLTTRRCIDFVIKETCVCNEKISSLFLANNRRMQLLQELYEKLSLITDQRDTVAHDMIELIPRDNFFKNEFLETLN